MTSPGVRASFDDWAAMWRQSPRETPSFNPWHRWRCSRATQDRAGRDAPDGGSSARPLAPAGASTRRRRISPSHGWKLRLDTGRLNGQARLPDTEWTSPGTAVIDGRPDASKTPSLLGRAHLALIPVVTVPPGRRWRGRHGL